jgi:transposase
MLDELARKRVQAGRLMLSGKTPAEVAKAVGVTRQTAYQWKSRLHAGGLAELRAMSNGRPRVLDAQQLKALRLAMRQGAAANGFDTPFWTIESVAALIERMFSVSCSQASLNRLRRAVDPVGGARAAVARAA